MCNTLIMMCSIPLYNAVKNNSETSEYRNEPFKDFLDKPDFYNKNRLPLDRLVDNNGNKIDSDKYVIVNGIKEYSPEERNFLIHDMAKNWFVQWCEIAFYYEEERKKHVFDELWEKMLEYSPKPTPGPTPQNTAQGSPPCRYAQENAFRIVPSPLLSDNEETWYILWDLGNLDKGRPAPGPTP